MYQIFEVTKFMHPQSSVEDRSDSAPMDELNPSSASELEDHPELRKFLKKFHFSPCQISEYHKALVNSGWDDLDYMKGRDENYLNTQLKDIMKPGHLAKFIDGLKESK